MGEEINNEKHFYVAIDDKYHRAFLEYDGINKIKYTFGGKGILDGYIGIVLSEEEKEPVISKYNQLKEYAKESGIDYYTNGFENVSVVDGTNFKMVLGNDYDALNYAHEIEKVIMDKHPEIYEKYKLAIEFIEQNEKESKQKGLDDLSISTLKEKYPVLFDANGELKKESISLIMTLIDTYVPKLSKQEELKNEVVK